MRNLAPLLLIVSGCITEPGLFIDKTGEGKGRVVSDPAGIDCGAQCGAIVTGPVTLVATPSEGSTFVGWDGGGCSGTEPCTLDLTDNASVEAKFAIEYQTLTITPDPNGRVDSLRIECGDVCTAEYPTGMTVRLMASPANDYGFIEWSDGNTSNPRLFAVNESVTLAALFELRSSLTVDVQGVGMGRVTSTPAGISCGVTPTGIFQYSCSVPLRAGTVMTLHAEPSSSSTFAGWQGCTPLAGEPLSCAVEVTGVVNAAATFSKP